MKRLVIVGGGISGLSAAWAATDPSGPGGGELEVIVLERDAEVGGKARSLVEDGWLAEAGPNGFLDNEPLMDRLVAAAGLEEERMPAQAAAARRFIVRGGRMREVHPHPLKFARSGLLSMPGMLRVAGEILVPARRNGGDETVWEFARRRIGREAADRLIAPMVLGVFAGDARRLSLPSAFPRLAELEREHGSLIRGMIARMKEAKRARREAGGTDAAGAGAPRAAGGPAGPGGQLHSFRHGLQSFPRALAERGRFTVRRGAEARSVRRRPEGGWTVVVRQGSDESALDADAVVLAGEPWAIAPLVSADVPEVARRLESIPCPPVTVLALGYDLAEAPGVPRGFGVLIPRGEGYRILGCLWDTHLFPGRSPDGKLLVRVMLGGTVDPEAALLPEEKMMEIVQADLGRLLGLPRVPRFRRVVRWPRAIPQYELGHGERVRAIESDLDKHPGLFVAGNALHGIAFAKAAAAGYACGERARGVLLADAVSTRG